MMTFDEFYVYWYPKMKRFAREYVSSDEDAEDIIHDFFLDLYETYNSLSSSLGVNMVAYTFTAIKNRCIDNLRHKIIVQESKVRIKEQELLALQMTIDSLEAFDNNLFNDRDIAKIVDDALQTLPERCREILIKHKIEGMRQKDIAAELNISPKTIENQLTIAYKKLREKLGKHPNLFSLLLSLY